MIGTFVKRAGVLGLLAASLFAAAPASAQGWGPDHDYRTSPRVRPHVAPPHYGYGPPDHNRRWKWRRHNHYGWYGHRPYRW